jgi:Na+/proline symporter
MIAGWVIILSALIYLSGLFALAHFGDIHGQKFRSGRSSATLYALTLAVYCTSWTFFGSVGLASNTGFDFLAIYIGPIIVIGFGHGFVERIVKLSKEKAIVRTLKELAAQTPVAEVAPVVEVAPVAEAVEAVAAPAAEESTEG